MPRGVYQRKEGVSAMTVEEIAEAEKRLEGQVSPLPAPKAAAVQTVSAPDGSSRQRVGNFSRPAQMGDSGTLRHFAHTPAPRDGWIEMTPEMAQKYENERRLIAYNSDEGIGYIRREPSPLSQKRTT